MRKLSIFIIICLLFSITAVWAEGQSDKKSSSGSSSSGSSGFFDTNASAFGGAGSANNAFDSMNKEFNRAEKIINLEDDYYLGRAVAANIMSMPNYRLYTGSPRLTNYLNQICQTLVINTPNTAVFQNYYVAILDSREFNAFATPGGHILITKGLIEATKSEDALAALIAHEIAHIILRHAAEIIDEMALSNELDSIAKQAAALTGNSKASQQALALRKSTAPIVDKMIKSGFSQPQEFAADAKALEILNAAGYNPRALLEILQVLQSVQSSQSGGFNSTHPTPAQRISNVNGLVSRYPANNTQALRQSRFINK